ncbi:hypothetical protein [Arthrobacter sp. 4R501]|uniref:hypothetical protein n=1 Tax=Arthrobacter sp. 4R501 TaxID=2058886 RepID=UPI000CE32616|nr:hypothetical protein [Arthrobacter sp. 4R501]
MVNFRIPARKECTLKSEPATTEIELLTTLVEGDRVEAFDQRGIGHWRGTVEASAPHLGVAWIRTDTRERKMLDVREHSIRRFPLSSL